MHTSIQLHTPNLILANTIHTHTRYTHSDWHTFARRREPWTWPGCEIQKGKVSDEYREANRSKIPLDKNVTQVVESTTTKTNSHSCKNNVSGITIRAYYSRATDACEHRMEWGRFLAPLHHNSQTTYASKFCRRANIFFSLQQRAKSSPLHLPTLSHRHHCRTLQYCVFSYVVERGCVVNERIGYRVLKRI